MAKKKTTENNEIDYDLIADELGADVLGKSNSVKNWIDTGNLSLNFLCSGKFVGGGIPSGKMIEIFGNSSSCKTLFALNILSGVQKAGGFCAFLDAEGTLSKEFAEKAAHVDPNQVLVVPPTKVPTLERCFKEMHRIIRKVSERYGSSRPIVIVYDSIAASPSEREYANTNVTEGMSKEKIKALGGGAARPGERAKTSSEELRTLNPLLDQYNCSVVFINQLRQKIGVMYGCFSGNSKVMLEDGSWMKISKIVNKKLPVKVISYDPKTGEISAKSVIDWHHNGFIEGDEHFLHIKFERPFGNQVGSMRVTPNHVIYVYNNGKIEETTASEIKENNYLQVLTKRYLTEDHMQIVYGSILGDGSIRNRKGHSNSVLRFRHGYSQLDYLSYKANMFGKLMGNINIKKEKHKVYCDIKAVEELNHLREYKPSYKIPQEIADNLNELGLAIWYLDDGTYGGYHEKWGSGKSYIYCLKWKNKEIMLGALERLGLKSKITKKGFVFDAENTIKLHQLICRFVPKCMEYKLHPKFHDLHDYRAPDLNERWETCAHKVISVNKWNHSAFKSKYDLTVEGNHTYVVGGAVVHNSDKTTAGGGMALEYYTSLRLETRASKRLKDKLDNVIGMSVSVANQKNKCFRPFITAKDMQLYFDRGINPLGGLLDLLKKQGRIISSSAGNYTVAEPWAGGEEIKFKSSMERNDVPPEVLLKCPALVDATNASQIQWYLDRFGMALETIDTDIAEDIDENGMDS
jgi:recombination protein RecA